SHTAALLADVLAAGPHARRERYDPLAAEQKRSGDRELHEVAAESKLPWEVDGRSWHTLGRTSHKGTPCLWDGGLLDWVERKIHELGKFSPTDWNDRTVIEIAAPKKSQGWFFHGMTGLERYVRLVFRVGRNTFKVTELAARLKLAPL